MSKSNPPVVITRKDKRLHKGAHLIAFALTGGASGAVTAAKAGTNAAYNARTRELQRRAEAPERPVVPHGFPEAPRGNWGLIAVSPVPVTAPRACPRCGRSGGTVRRPGTPHTGMGRKWCPGVTEPEYRMAGGRPVPVQDPATPTVG